MNHLPMVRKEPKSLVSRGRPGTVLAHLSSQMKQIIRYKQHKKLGQSTHDQEYH